MKKTFGTRGTGIGTGTRISSGPRDWDRDRRLWDAWDWDTIRWDVPGLTLSGTRVPGTQIPWDSWDVPCPSLGETILHDQSHFRTVLYQGWVFGSKI